MHLYAVLLIAGHVLLYVGLNVPNFSRLGVKHLDITTTPRGWWGDDTALCHDFPMLHAKETADGNPQVPYTRMDKIPRQGIFREMLHTSSDHVAKAQARECCLGSHSYRPLGLRHPLQHLVTQRPATHGHLLRRHTKATAKFLIKKRHRELSYFYLWFNGNNLFLGLGSG